MTGGSQDVSLSLVHSEGGRCASGAELRGRLTPGAGKVSDCGRSGQVAAVGVLQLVA